MASHLRGVHGRNHHCPGGELRTGRKRIQAHAPSSIMLTVTLLCAGIFLGVMTQTGMV